MSSNVSTSVLSPASLNCSTQQQYRQLLQSQLRQDYILQLMKLSQKSGTQEMLYTEDRLVKHNSYNNTNIYHDDDIHFQTRRHLDSQKRQKVSQYIGKMKSSHTHMTSRMNEHSELNNKSQLKWQLNNIELELNAHKGVEKFMIAFAQNPYHAIEEGIQKHQISADPGELAGFLIDLEGLNKAALGEYFGANSSESKEVLREYCKLLHFQNIQFDKAIRLLLSRFKLPGEAQQIERILLVFSEEYYQTHKAQFFSAGEIHVLSYSLIMLNTDAHSSHQQTKMTKQQFIKNTSPVCPGILKTYLEGMYDRVTQEKFETETNFIEKIYDRLSMLKVNLNGERVAEILKSSVELLKGHIFIKYCLGVVKSVQRKIFLSDDEKMLKWVDPNKEGDTPRSLSLDNMIDLTLGCNSPVMRKNKVPKEFDSMCFSIQFTTRTLDLKAKDPEHRAKWVNYLRALLIMKRNENRLRREQFIREELNKADIEQIWNTDIFPHWDQHWDYRSKRPKEERPIKTFFKKIICCTIFRKQKDPINEAFKRMLMDKSKQPLLVALWKYGLPEASRKTMWPLVIGNNLKINKELYEIYEDKRKSIISIQKMPYSHEAIQIVELFEIVRPDIGLIRNLLELAEVFLKYMDHYSAFISFTNMIHGYHFLAFFQGELQEIELRIKFFDWLININCPVVSNHFKAMEVSSKLYLVNWFLSIFSTSFEGELLGRIWDNFLLEGEVYLFKVGITIVKYFQFQLKMSTFEQAIRLLSYPKDVSEVIFFQILEGEVEVERGWFEEFIERRNDAMVKTKVQEIPLQ